MGIKTTLYDQDFYAWTQEQAALLREGAVQDLDLTNLAEEIESLGKSEMRALESHLEVLVLHLLKWQYQPARRQTGHSWRATIRTQRAALADMLEESPSMARELFTLLTKGYSLARQWASDDTHLPLATFPVECPWSLEQVLAEDFWPEGGPQ